jgi:hypothetical protein
VAGVLSFGQAMAPALKMLFQTWPAFVTVRLGHLIAHILCPILPTMRAKCKQCCLINACARPLPQA